MSDIASAASVGCVDLTWLLRTGITRTAVALDKAAVSDR